ncbi:MAG TPA: transglutaminase-like domain-containing protein [Flavobacterium sp.]|jgi:hypothetical protein
MKIPAEAFPENKKRIPALSGIFYDLHFLPFPISYIWKINCSKPVAFNKTTAKLKWFIRRHPLIYFMRYLLLSENHKGNPEDDTGCFNDTNNISEVPDIFFKVNNEIVFPDGDEFSKALTIARFLRDRVPVGPSASLSSAKTLEQMLYGKGGVCNDFSQVFNIFCLINNIRVKEWNCVDRLYKTRYGHTFNEIFVPQLNYWVAIDIHKGIYFNDTEGNPLSATALFQNLRNSKKVNFIYYSDYRPAKPERLQFVYSGNTIPFIISNYNNKLVDEYLDKYRNMPPFVAGLMMVMAGKNYHFTFVLDNYKEKMFPFLFRNHNRQKET